MIHSMTGYGLASGIVGRLSVTIQVKSVNTRYVDIFIKFPGVSVDFEQEIRARLQQRVTRGRLDLFVEVRSPEGDIRAVNLDAARGYLAQLRLLKTELGVTEEIRLRDILTLPGILESIEREAFTESTFQKGFLALLDDALDQLLAMRRREGDILASVIADRLDVIERDLEESASFQEGNKDFYRQRLQKRIEEILPERDRLDPTRFNQEVAYLADRSDIAEEIDRFRAHIRQFRQTLDEGGPAGKKLDFIVQEMNREVNTILSKSEIREIKERGIEIKSEIEKIREQVQNIE